MPEPTTHTSRTADGPLTDAYRVIRTIGPPDAPLAGALAREGENVVLLVDVATLESWEGWSFDRAQHVLGPIDIARRPDGHVVVLPWCTERIDVFLGRRRAADSPLSGGELVTLVISALRGTAEAHRGRAGDEPSPTGSWWITDAGRPVFVHGQSGSAVEAGARRMVEELASDCEDRVLIRLLSGTMTALERPRTLGHEANRLEAELFDACAPQPLATTVFPAARVRDLEAPALRPTAASGTRDFPRPLRDAIARHVDGELADAVAVSVGGAVRGLRARLARGRRAPWLAAAGIAGAIVLAGALWPGGGPDPAAQAVESGTGSTAASAGPSPLAAPVTSASTTPLPSQQGPASELPLDSEAARLLDGWAACRSATDGSCRDDLLERPDLEPIPGVIDLPAEQRTLTLLDDYGGVAVLRVESVRADASPQLIVIIRADQRWLLRDVYDVAEQPSG